MLKVLFFCSDVASYEAIMVTFVASARVDSVFLNMFFELHIYT